MHSLRAFIERGYIIAATDYPGLGMPGPHPFLVGTSEGRAVLDMVRAAQELAGPSASRQVGLWGHSQGGQAVLFAPDGCELGRDLVGGFLLDPRFTDHEPWRRLLADNTAGVPPPSLPAFLAQGAADDTVRPRVTLAYARRLCATGAG